MPPVHTMGAGAHRRGANRVDVRGRQTERVVVAMRRLADGIAGEATAGWTRDVRLTGTTGVGR